MLIAVDAMGGDFAPKEPCEAAILACKKNKNLNLALVGDTEKIKPFLEKADSNVRSRIDIVHAEEVISFDDSPSISIRKKKKSSLVVAFNMVRSGEADGVVSSGSTGAIAAGAVLLLGRIPGIDRPGLGVATPFENRTTLIMDVGGTVHCKPINLYQFALMGSIYMKLFYNVENPSVKLLCNGVEDIKGDEVISAARDMLLASNINYEGYAEGTDIPKGIADVVICDGFTGNALLKFGEGLGELIKRQFKEEFKHHTLPKIGLIFMWPAIRRIMARFEWEKYGGLPFLGVNGSVVKVHGRSKANALFYAINGTANFINNKGVGRIREELERKNGQDGTLC
ncbi:MAG: phosphate acyltransferase PlsX [Synergistes sp.]|nr:phosphate acyltransferase PlsX [Synergistes sp.]